MEQLQIFANIAEIVGATIVVIGVIFAVVQMRQNRQQRRELAAIELFRFFGNPHFTRAFKRVLLLPDDLKANDVRLDEQGLENEAMLICSTMENIGVMTHQRIVPFIVVNHLIGASAIILWNKLQPWVNALREETDNDFIFEWFQWLVMQLDQYDNENQRPAHEAYSDWVPRHLLRKP